MATILLIDENAGRKGALANALCDAGFDVKTVSDPHNAPSLLKGVNATVLVASEADLGILLGQTRALREEGTPPMVLAADLDRSGWDRTFSSAEAFEVDALFDLPVDPEALIARLKGIVAARTEALRPVETPEFHTIIARAMANEEAAEAFYRRAAEATENSVTRDALLSLASDEAEHKQALLDFQSGKRSLPEGETETVASLTETFGTPDLTPDLAPADAFLLAARKEKLAVEFYQNWATLYPAGPERELLLGLAEVERQHQARVEQMFSQAAFPESF